MVKIGYARVSTRSQKIDRQIDELLEHGVRRDKIFIDYYSGRTLARENFQACWAALDPGDCLVVTDLDRLGRSTVEVLQTADALRARDVNLMILRYDVDTSTSEGKLFYTLAAALAQFEAEKLSERTKQGLDAARRRGRVGGRPRALQGERADYALDLLNQGESIARVATLLGVSRSAVRTLVADQATRPQQTRMSD